MSGYPQATLDSITAYINAGGDTYKLTNNGSIPSGSNAAFCWGWWNGSASAQRVFMNAAIWNYLNGN